MGKRISEFLLSLVWFFKWILGSDWGGAWLVFLCCGFSVLGTVCRKKCLLFIDLLVSLNIQKE